MRPRNRVAGHRRNGCLRIILPFRQGQPEQCRRRSHYKCPNPATNLPYDVHGSVDLDNSTSNTLTDAQINTFSPKSVRSGDKATIKFTVQFNCTNSGPATSTYGDFDLKFTLVTSAGTYTIASGNQHRLVIT